MASLIIQFSDNADINQAPIGGTLTIALDGLLVTSDDDLRDLGEAVINTRIARQTVGLPIIGGGAIWLNTLQMTGMTRDVEVQG